MKSIYRTCLWLLCIFAVSGCSLFAPRETPAASVTPLPGQVAANPAVAGSSQPAEPQTEQKTTQAPSATYTAPTALPMPDISGLPSLDALSPGWNQIDPGGSTTCARGGAYSFFVRKTSSDKLLIYFEGGGSCYNAATCRDGANTFDASIDTAFDADNPALKYGGVFGLDNPSNPFKDYNIVFINYCTGDGYMGSRVVEYQGDDGAFQVNHMGFTNTQTVLQWTYQNFTQPKSLFMIGCSAGVIGSYIHAPFVLEHYKNIPATLVGDSGGGYLDGPISLIQPYGILDQFPAWIPQYADLRSSEFLRSSSLFIIPATTYPDARFALLDTTDDAPQSKLIARFDKSLTLAQVVDRNLAEIQSGAPNFYRYTGPGDYHCITMNPVFYEYTVNNTRLVDWFARLEAGQTVDNVAP